MKILLCGAVQIISALSLPLQTFTCPKYYYFIFISQGKGSLDALTVIRDLGVIAHYTVS